LDRGTEPRLLKADEYFLTANVCLPVEPLRHLGGFDSALGPKEGRPMVNDDLQVSADLLAAGITFAWTPSATVVHDVPDSRLQPLWFASRLHCQGRSDLLLARHFDQVSTGDGLRLARERAWNAVHGLRYRAGWTRAHLMFILGSLIRAEGLARESLASSRIRKSIRRRARLG
jgi:hypothetical protein